MENADLAQLRQTFLTETSEDLAIIEESLLELDSAPDDHESLAVVYRKLHSLKGNALCVGLTALGGFAHSLEDLLQKLSNAEEPVTQAHVTYLLKVVDALREGLPSIAAGREDLPQSCELLRDQVQDGHLRRLSPAAAAGGKGGDEVETPGEGSRTLRIETASLDRLLNMMTELTIQRGRLRLLIEGDGSRETAESYDSMERLLTDLHQLVTRVRLVPIAPLFRWHTRVVRDMAVAQAKEVQLVIADQGVEVDTTVVEQLKAPLTHMIRNAVSHGIEPPLVREQRGKGPVGRIELRARYEEGGISVEVQDDGGGLDRERVLAKARELGIVPEGVTPSEREIDRLIFAQGLSTAGELTNISGRGVGMDAVMRNLDAIGGSIEVRSRRGEGTCFTIRTPRTLAIVDAFLLGVGDETFVMPMASVVRCVALSASEARRSGDGVVEVGGQPVPFLRLRAAFDLAEPSSAQEIVVVVRHAGQLAGVAADRLIGKRQVVVKPPGSHFKGLRPFSGLTILGDGHVAPILNVAGLLGDKLESARAEAAV